MSKTYCVLVVDDEPTLCDVLALYFELENFKVLKSSNGFEAVEVLKNNADIDFVVSDVRMPDGDGVFLLNYIKKNCASRIKIIMLSGFTTNLEEDLKKLGALALFPKPTEPRQLVAFVKSQIQN